MKADRFFFNFDSMGASLNIGRATYQFKELVIDFIPNPGREVSYCNLPHIAFMGEERYGAHDVLGFIEFKNKENLKRARDGLKLLEKAIADEQEEAEASRRKR